MHAGTGERRAGIDGVDAAMSHRAAQDCSVQQAITDNIVDELTAATQKAQILDTLDRAADQRVRLAEIGTHPSEAQFAPKDGGTNCNAHRN